MSGSKAQREYVSAKGLSYSYGALRALHAVSCSFGLGEVVAVVGSNAAGKSTLMRIVAGLLRTSGTDSLTCSGRDVRNAGVRERLIRFGVALVPEGRGVLHNLTVAENLALGARVGRRRTGVGADFDLERVADLFPALSRRSALAAGAMSGGEQQMLALARALLCRPSMLLLDEPTVGLAPNLVTEIMSTLIGEALGPDLGIVLVEQNTSIALENADRLYVLTRGNLSESITVEEARSSLEFESSFLGI